MKAYQIIAVIASSVFFFVWQNNALEVTRHSIIKKNLPKEFDGFKILHISDLHNKNFRGRLDDAIFKIKPDIIVITGDLIDRRRTDIGAAAVFLREIVKTAPVYYVTGNHEQMSEHYNKLQQTLSDLNVKIMDGSYVAINRQKSVIGIMGAADPAINFNMKDYGTEINVSYMEDSIKKLLQQSLTDFNILLSHRAEFFSLYKRAGIDFVFAGHAHGGQIRLPFLGGVLSPNQGFFPKYSEGIITDGTTSMSVSRGLGNSIFPLRIFNRPELVVVTLQAFS